MFIISYFNHWGLLMNNIHIMKCTILKGITNNLYIQNTNPFAEFIFVGQPNN